MLSALVALIPLIILLWTFLFYPISLRYWARKRKICISKDESFTPYVSIVIPTFNEEKVIANKLKNIFELNYPQDRMEIVVVDGASNDRTIEIVREISMRFDREIKVLLQPKREGEYAGTNLALGNANGEIILQSDANAFFSSDFLRKVIRNFTDPTVGGVTPCYYGISGSAKGISAQEEMYWRTERELWKLESKVDSCSTMLGEALAFRKSIISRVESLGAGDLSLTIQIRRAGFRVVYEPEARVWEPIPATVRDLFKQKRRRTYNTLVTLIRLHKDLFNPKLGLFGLVILPTHKLFTALTPFMILLLVMWVVQFVIL